MTDQLLSTILGAGGGGGGGIVPLAMPYTFFVTSSQSWSCPYDGRVRIWAVGAGGQGAFGNLNTGASQPCVVTGGGAGGVSFKTSYDVTAGQVLTCALGAGGSGQSAGNNTFVNGIAGGDTTVTGTNLSLVGGGGGGGNFRRNGDITDTLGGTGGVATGGDFNYTGGDGGSVINMVDAKFSATGGGGWWLFGNGGRGGNVDGITLVGGFTLSTGGGGSQGNGGDIVDGIQQSSTTGGGGWYDAEILNSTDNTGLGGAGLTVLTDNLAGYYPTTPATLYVGGNAPGVFSAGNQTYGGTAAGNSSSNAGSATYFGGGGGNATGSSSSGIRGGNVTYGGGSGGGANLNTAGGGIIATTAGNGLVIIQYVEIA